MIRITDTLCLSLIANQKNTGLNFSFCQMFDQLALDGTATFSINISESCQTCYNVRLLKVRGTERNSLLELECNCYMAILLVLVFRCFIPFHSLFS